MMWGMPYEQYEHTVDMSTLSGKGRDFWGFGRNDLVYQGHFLFAEGINLYVAHRGLIKVLPVMLLRGFMAPEETADEIALAIACDGSAN